MSQVADDAQRTDVQKVLGTAAQAGQIRSSLSMGS
jgi:hypothetical protein